MNAKDAVNTVKRAMLHPDYKITKQEADIINAIYKKYNIRTTTFKAGDNGQAILENT